MRRRKHREVWPNAPTHWGRRPVSARLAIVCMVIVGIWGLALGLIIDRDPEPASGRVEIICHPVEGDATGTRVCVVP